MQNSYLPNFSYLFVPVTTENNDDFSNFHKELNEQNGWKPDRIENRYLHRFVVEKISNNDNNGNTHFVLDEKFAEQNGLYLGNKWYTLGNKKYKGEENADFSFMISNVELFTFSTAICILAFELRFKDNDPLKIAATQYYLRKISTEQIYLADDTEKAKGESFVDISARMLNAASSGIPLDFFFYAARHNEKANFLTYVDVPEKKNYDEELFYLKWCYSDGFDYVDEQAETDSENYYASKSIAWGISASAAVCLVCKSESQAEFIEKSFQKNFRKQYLMTYILLLHQKYMMYLFLTKASVGLEGDLVQLEKYKAMLYDFETHYMFSYISEVPQYQRFYNKVSKMFCLDVLFEDVQEPLVELTEIKKQKAEKEQRDYDYRLNTALTTLSLLTVVSALTDATGITANLTWFIPPYLAKILQLGALGCVVIISMVMLVRLIFLKKR